LISVNAKKCPFGFGGSDDADSDHVKRNLAEVKAPAKPDDSNTKNIEDPAAKKVEERPTKGAKYPSELFTCTAKTKVLKTVDGFTTGDYEAVAKSVLELYEARADTEKANNNPRADFAGCLLRLAGHDFMDFRYMRDMIDDRWECLFTKESGCKFKNWFDR